MDKNYNIERVKGAKTLVIGDIMLDRYIFGSVARISPEAPVPVVKAGGERETLGGAANVANNISGLKAKCTLVGTAGADEYRNSMINMLTAINVEHRIFDAGLQTTAKIRVLGDRQQVVRIDYEDILPGNSAVFPRICRCVDEMIPANDAIVLSDYGKGLMTADLCQHVIKSARASNKVTVVDPKGANWDKYYGATLITPNVKELSEVFGDKIPNEDGAVEKAGKIIREKFALTYLVVTRSEKGVSVISESGVLHMPTQAQEVYDVSGAGDTVVATLACVLGSGGSIEEAISVSNKAAGIVVSKIGTVPIKYEELLQSYITDDISGAVQLAELMNIVENEKAIGNKVVFTNGCFDILHRGHVSYLKEAKKQGGVLVVGLNSDDSVRRLKGESRPLNNQNDRALVLSSLKDVDYVVIFDEDTPEKLLSQIKPDILVKGGDYTVEQVLGRQYAKEVKIIDFVEGYSTTNTVNKMCDTGGC